METHIIEFKSSAISLESSPSVCAFPIPTTFRVTLSHFTEFPLNHVSRTSFMDVPYEWSLSNSPDWFFHPSQSVSPTTYFMLFTIPTKYLRIKCWQFSMIKISISNINSKTKWLNLLFMPSVQQLDQTPSLNVRQIADSLFINLFDIVFELSMSSYRRTLCEEEKAYKMFSFDFKRNSFSSQWDLPFCWLVFFSFCISICLPRESIQKQTDREL